MFLTAFLGINIFLPSIKIPTVLKKSNFINL